MPQRPHHTTDLTHKRFIVGVRKAVQKQGPERQTARAQESSLVAGTLSRLSAAAVLTVGTKASETPNHDNQN